MLNLYSLGSRSILGAIIFLFFTSAIFAQYKIMPLGDSITRGEGSSADGGYRDDLDSLLTDAGELFNFVGTLSDTSGDHDRDHEGHDAWPADSVDFHINTLMNSYNPDIVLLHIGTNNISGDENTLLIINEISSIVDKIYNYDTSTIILLCSLIPRTDLTSRDEQTTALNQSIETLVYDKRTLGYIIYYVGQNEIFKSNNNWATDYMVNNLHPNDTGYNLMAQVFFNAILNAINSSGSIVTDNFNRTKLGITWVADPEYIIVNNQLSNTSAVDAWDFMAVYVTQINPKQVSFTWGVNADANGIDLGGFALMLNSPSPDADGYLVWRRTSDNRIDLWTIVNGVPDTPIAQTATSLPPPSAGDEFKIILSTDGSGHHFDCFINGSLDARISDLNKLQGNGATLYSGVYLRGNKNNDIDNFNIIQSSDETRPAAVIDLSVGLISATSIELTWKATGDDSLQGTASSYDLRYATTLITNENFPGATKVTGLPTPSGPSTPESFFVTNLQPNTTYYFALKVLDEANNASDISNVPTATTLSGFTFTDDFNNRSELGTDWNADPEYQIVSGELDNTSALDQWGFMAVYTARKNPLDVSIQWGSGADANGIDGGGFAIMLNSSSPDADGYLVWKKPTQQLYDLWTIVNGQPAQSITQVASTIPGPAAGGTFKVVPRSDDSGHHFDCFIDGQFDATISDVNKLQGNGSILYSGVMLRGGRNNNVDEFSLTYQVGNPTSLVKDFGDNQTGVVNTTLPDSLVVLVSDQNGNPVPNVGIDYTVTEGNGSVNVVATLDKIRVEAESGILTAPMQIAADPLASNGNYIWVPVGAGTNGVAEYSFDVPTDDTYVIWGRVIAPNGSEDSFFISMDGGPDVLWDVLQGLWQSDWTWDQVSDRGTGSSLNPEFDPKLFQLTAGTHNLKIKQRDAGTKIDKIIITSDLNFVPSGLEETSGLETDINGKAFAFLTLGTTAGNNSVQVSAAGLIPVTFTATGTADSAETIEKISGDDQIAPPGTLLPEPFVVELKDLYGNLVANFPVNWDVITGNGTLSSPSPVFTDENGQASDTLTMATNGPINEVLVTAPGVVGDSVIFRATAEPGDPATLVVLSGDDQVGQANQVLPESLSVKITDVIGTPKSNHPVTFEVKSGGGTLNDSLSIITRNANGNGIAEVSWTLGPELGAQNTVEVSSSFNGNPLNNSPHTFQATALAPSILAKESGDNQTGTANKALSQPFEVKVTSNDGTPVAGVEVTFTVTGGGGNFSGTSSTIVFTNDLGIAETTLTLGPTPGATNTAQATASFDSNPLVGSPIDFTATSAVPQTLVRVSEDTLNGPVNSSLSDSVKVQVLDALDQPLENWDVIFAVTMGGGNVNGSTIDTVQTDANGIAGAEWTLGGVAGDYNNKLQASATFNSQPLGSPIEFVASAEPGTATDLVKVSGDSLNGVIQNPLPEPFVVQVTDGSNPIVGWSVTFTVIEGGGNINGSQSVVVPTNASGEASATLTLGNISGLWNNVVEAAAENGDPLNGSPIRFVATAAANNASKLIYVAGNNQNGQAGESLPQQVQVKVTDNQDNPISGHPVTFKVTKGGGTINGLLSSDTLDVVPTNESGIASVTWYLGGTIGTNSQALEINANDGVNDLDGSPMTILASATAGPVDPDASYLESNVSQLPADGQTTATITVAFTDKFGNPVEGKAVNIISTGSFNIINNPASLTDENGQAVGTIASTKAEVKSISARNVSDGFDLNTTINVEFLPLDPDKIEESSGNGQIANIGTALENPIVVIVKDVNNNPVPDVSVEILVNDGGGFILNESSPPQGALGKFSVAILTDSEGKASANWVLGPNPGTNTAEARVTGLTGSPVVFTANGVNATATNMESYSGDNQEGVMAGRTLPDPLKVRVTDANGKPVWNVPVTFTITLGGGSLSNENAVTDYQGIAQTNLTLGPTVGTNMVEASNASLSGSPVTFFFVSVEGTPAILTAFEGDGGSGAVNSLYPISIKITDIHENPVAGVHAGFQVIEGGASIESAENATDASGIARAQVRLPTSIGTVKVKATSNDLPDFFVTFSISVVSGQAVYIELFDGNNQTGTVGRELVFPLELRVNDTYGNPVSGHQVQWVPTQGSGSLKYQTTSTDEDGMTANIFTLGAQPGINEAYAIASTLSGSPIIFTATGVINNFPVFVGLNDTSVVEGNLLEFQVNATDDDSDPITYEAEDLPLGATFNQSERTFNWTPGDQQSGEYKLTFIARDDQGGLDAETITITVKNSNHPPVLSAWSPQDFDLVFIKGVTILFSVTATDADQDELTYKWEKDGMWVASTPQYEFITSPLDPKSYIITVEVSDNQDVVSLEWKIDIVVSVELSSFQAQFDGFNGVKISWTTSREIDNRGYNILGSLTRNGDFTKLNDELIASNDKGVYHFIDLNVEVGRRYFYILEDVDIRGVKTQHGPISVDITAPKNYELSQNYPNPFNPETKIRYQLPEAGQVVVKIYNLLGREVKTLVNERKEAGFHVVTWDAKDNFGREVSSGIYYYRIIVGTFHQTNKMVFMK
ncbi:MAG: Ig-like domain-containing protein [bacterium]